MHETHAEGRAEVKNLSDEELIKLLPAEGSLEISDEERAVFDELWNRHTETIRVYLRKKIYSARSICPRNEDRDDFLEASFARAYIRYRNEIHRDYKFHNFVGLLCILALSAALDERRKLTGVRGPTKDETTPKPKRTFVSPEGLSLREQLLFHTECYTFPIKARLERPFHKLASNERKRVVRELLTMHATKSDRDLRSAKVLRWRFWREWGVRQIADYLFGAEPIAEESKDQAIRRTIVNDCEKLRQLLDTEFHIVSYTQL